MLFFRRKLLLPEPDLSKPSGVKLSASPDLLRILSTRSSMNVLNSFGASSGCNLAGTQNNLEASFSSSDPFGATVGITPPKEGRSGSAVSTFIDIRRMACKLLNSCATAAGLDS
jgi:hypothetical protein